MNRYIRYLANFLPVYMIAAFTWWAVQLWNENDRMFATECMVLRLKHPQIANFGGLQQLDDFGPALRRHARRRRMIVAEGLFFSGCMAFGFWVVRRSARRELALARQRRNFLLSITHELKSPLAAIKLIFETVARRELNADQKKQLTANGLRDASRLQNLVEDLLLAARLEDRWKPHPEPVSLPVIVQDILAGLKIRFPKGEILVQMSDSLDTVVADKSGITSVIQNLIENALKYSPEGSTVRFSAERTNGKVSIQVADQGQGIPDSEKAAVFQKFYRLGNEETRQTTGTGLGLYIVQQVVQAHGGQIFLRDNQPQGTVFTVVI